LELDLSTYHDKLTITENKGKRYIYDPIRKKQLVLQPEELVRQTWIQYLHHKHQLSFASLAVEKQLTLASVVRRYDLVYYQKGKPYILFEFKSYKLVLTQDNAQQISNYNLELKVPYLVLSNGLQTMVYTVSQATRQIEKLNVFPPIS